MNYPYPADPGANWCPDCGLPRGVCDCEWQQQMEDEDDLELDPSVVCPHCRGTGISPFDDFEECDHCDGMGYEWWWH